MIRYIVCALVGLTLGACQGHLLTTGQALRESRLAACGFYVARYEAVDLSRLTDAQFAKARADFEAWQPVCTGAAPTLETDPAAIRAAGQWLVAVTGGQ